MFEAPGVWDSRSYSRRHDRINWDRFNTFRQQVAPIQSGGLIYSVVANDYLFSTNPGTAYAEAWALSFYFMETQPRKFWDYLSLTTKYPGRRVANFETTFGSNYQLLNAQIMQFMAKLP